VRNNACSRASLKVIAAAEVTIVTISAMIVMNFFIIVVVLKILHVVLISCCKVNDKKPSLQAFFPILREGNP
jgi:hypothetical protein